MTRLFFSLLLSLTVTACRAQVNDYGNRIQVLEKAIVDSEFVFGKWDTYGNTETHLKYLGSVKTVDGKEFKIMNSVWIWGLSSRHTNRILTFNSLNQYMGTYPVTLDIDLPQKLEVNKLIFINSSLGDCDINSKTIIDLSAGLPKVIRRKCRDNSFDEYRFE